MTNHPTLDQLREFGLGRLDDDSMDSVSEHVAICDTCCQKLAEVHDDTLIEWCKQAGGETEAEESEGLSDDALRQARQALEQAFKDHPRYKLRSPLGQGGMGLVYKAEHRLMDRLVAIKVIHPALTANPKAIDRFQREIRAAGKLNHKNIVAALDAEQTGVFHYLVMEFAPGVSLDRIVKHRGVLAVPAACRIIQQAAQGLAHAHERHMVHRDIKPQNLLATLDGQVKILDFGLARFASEHRAAGSLTGDGMLGTPEYMSPEQIQQANEADIRSDIYSLGCTLYYLLTGQSPFGGDDMGPSAILMAHISKPVAPLSYMRDDIPPQLDAIVAKMLAKAPADRFQSPAEVVAAMDGMIRGGPTDRDAPRVTVVSSQTENDPNDDGQPIELTSIPVLPHADWGALEAQLPTIDSSLPTDPLALDPRRDSASSRLLTSRRRKPRTPPWVWGGAVVAALGLILIAAAMFNRVNVKFLVFVPDEYWEKDLEDVTATLENQGAEYDLFSVSGNVVAFNTRQPMTVGLSLGQVSAAPYSGVIVLGGNTLLNAGNPDLEQLLEDFANQSKLVAAICTGQKILHQAGMLDRKKIARINIQYNDSIKSSSAIETNQDVVLDGRLLTCSDDQAAAGLARAAVRWARGR